MHYGWKHYTCNLIFFKINGPSFVHWCSDILEQEVAISKLFTQRWEHELAQKCCTKNNGISLIVKTF